MYLAAKPPFCMKKILLSLPAAFLTILTAQAQQLRASVSDLAFLAGTWTQQHAWGDMEEVWQPPMGNCIVSTFRCVNQGKVVFYEFMVVEQGQQVPELKLRHFNPGSIAWEDKEHPEVLPVTELGKNRVVFSRTGLKLTYERSDPGKLIILLEEENKEKKWDTTRFEMSRKP